MKTCALCNAAWCASLRTMNPLREFRRRENLTLQDVGATVGVTESQMSRIERKGTTKATVALRLAELTGLPAETFVRTDGRLAA